MKRVAIFGSKNFKRSEKHINNWLDKVKNKFVTENDGIILMCIKDEFHSSLITEWATKNKIKVELFLDSTSDLNKFGGSYSSERHHQYFRKKKRNSNNNNVEAKQQNDYDQHNNNFSSIINSSNMKVKKQLLAEADFSLVFWDEECDTIETLLNYTKSIDKKSVIVFEDGKWKNW